MQQKISAPRMKKKVSLFCSSGSEQEEDNRNTQDESQQMAERKGLFEHDDLYDIENSPVTSMPMDVLDKDGEGKTDNEQHHTEPIVKKKQDQEEHVLQQEQEKRALLSHIHLLEAKIERRDRRLARCIHKIEAMKVRMHDQAQMVNERCAEHQTKEEKWKDQYQELESRFKAAQVQLSQFQAKNQVFDVSADTDYTMTANPGAVPVSASTTAAQDTGLGSESQGKILENDTKPLQTNHDKHDQGERKPRLDSLLKKLSHKLRPHREKDEPTAVAHQIEKVDHANDASESSDEEEGDSDEDGSSTSSDSNSESESDDDQRNSRSSSSSSSEEKQGEDANDGTESGQSKKGKDVDMGHHPHLDHLNHMNKYMKMRTERRQRQAIKKEAQTQAEHERQTAYEKEWESLAQEEKQRKATLNKQRQRRRPQSMKKVRVSQRRQHLQRHWRGGNKGETKKDSAGTANLVDSTPPTSTSMKTDEEAGDIRATADHQDEDEGDSENKTGEKEDIFCPPLPPKPSEAENKLYRRQQVRLKELHEHQQRQKVEAEEAETISSTIHHRLLEWAAHKTVGEMLMTLDTFTSLGCLDKCRDILNQASVIEPEVIRKAYR